MERCPRQHRIGETCGAKLVHHESVTKSSSMCKVCEEIHTKQRRLAKTHDNIHRWGKEPEKFSASLEKARREGNELEDKIKELHLRRSSIATNIKSTPKPQSTAANMLPPLTASYEYQSPQVSMSRRQDSGTVPRNTMMPTSTPSQYQTVSTSTYPVSQVNMTPTSNVSMSRPNVVYKARR